MTERSILAYFRTPEQAEQAAASLRNLGVEDLQIDRFSRYPSSGVDQLANSPAGNLSSLADIALNDVSTRDIGILTAADPGASGMADGNPNVESGRDIILAAVVDASVFEQAAQAIRATGGLV